MLINSIDEMRKICEGLSDELGLKTEEDIVHFSKEIRRGRASLNADLDPVEVLKAYDKGEIELDEDEILEEVVKIVKQVRYEMAEEKDNYEYIITTSANQSQT